MSTKVFRTYLCVPLKDVPNHNDDDGDLCVYEEV